MTASTTNVFSLVIALKFHISCADSDSLGYSDKLNLWKVWICVHLWGQKIWQRSLISLFLELQLGTSICDPTAMCLTYSWTKQLVRVITANSVCITNVKTMLKFHHCMMLLCALDLISPINNGRIKHLARVFAQPPRKYHNL